MTTSKPLPLPDSPPTASKPSTSSVAAFLAKTSAWPVAAPALPANDPDSGTNITGSSKKSARATSSSKTSLPFALADWTQSSAASLRSGMTRNGIAYPLPPLAPLTKGTGSGWWLTPNVMDALAPRTPEALKKQYEKNRQGRTTHSTLREQVVYPPPNVMWPTPAARDYRGANGYETTLKKISEGGRPHLDQLPNRVQLAEGRPIRGTLNPTWVEWLMGFPIGWTDSNS